MVKRFSIVLALTLLVLPGAAAPPSTCRLADDYSRALCAYQRRQFAEAEAAFRRIMEREGETPAHVKATYFLARTLMKRGRFAEAAELFVRIYQADRPFYDGWNCDFLLGECRRAMGKE